MLRENYHVLYIENDGDSLREPDEVLVSKDSGDLLENVISALAARGLRVQKSGEEKAEKPVREYMLMGSFPQNSPAPEPLEWLVLKTAGDRALLITKHVIDGRRFDAVSNDWQASEIYGWLNGEFLANTFTTEERARIVPSESGDSIFFLSAREADAFFYDDEERKGTPTPNAVDRGANHYDWADGKTWWWLRTPSDQGTGHGEALVSTFGSVMTFGDHVSCAHGGVRPALWINVGK